MSTEVFALIEQVDEVGETLNALVFFDVLVVEGRTVLYLDVLP